jgi:hypothetical protein
VRSDLVSSRTARRIVAGETVDLRLSANHLFTSLSRIFSVTPAEGPDGPYTATIASFAAVRRCNPGAPHLVICWHVLLIGSNRDGRFERRPRGPGNGFVCRSLFFPLSTLSSEPQK